MKMIEKIVVLACLSLAACSTESICPEGLEVVNGQCTLIAPDAPKTAPELSIEAGTKTLNFGWATIDGATSYKLLEDADGSGEFTQLGDDLSETSSNYAHTISVHTFDWDHAVYKLQACNEGGCIDSEAVSAKDHMLDAIGTLTASNAEAGDRFGTVAISADGSTLAVAAQGEDSGSPGIDADQDGNTIESAGAVYVFVRDDTNSWVQQAYIKAPNPGGFANFGYTLALSSGGNTLAVGAVNEGSSSTGIDGAYNGSAYRAGAAYVFSRDGNGQWSQTAYVKASNTETYDHFGGSVSLSADGRTLAVGAYAEDSDATGIGGAQNNNSRENSGAVYVYTATSDGGWSQQAYIKAHKPGADDLFGYKVSLSADGNTLAVGAHQEDGSGTGIDATVDDLSSNAGAVYVFVRNATSQWSQQAYIKSSNANVGDSCGIRIDLSSDGNTLAVACSAEDGAATGIGGDQLDNTAADAGAVYIFARDGNGSWSQQSYIKASNTEADDVFGLDVALNGDGQLLAVGAALEDGNAHGIGGDQVNNDALDAGAVYLFRRESNAWTQQSYIKSPVTETGDRFANVTLDETGLILAVGAWHVGNKLSDGHGTGAVYLY
ncbi:MAG: integrin [Myxococcales bacterium]|nr:MAG: integrin [Myxococcales bacterium]